MLHIPTVAFRSHGQDQWEMNGNCFCEGNRISLVQASQKQYRYGYDSQTSSLFAHNCKEQTNLTIAFKTQETSMQCHTGSKHRDASATRTNDSPAAPFIMFTKLLQHINFNHCCLSILFDSTYNFYGNHFFPLTIPALQYPTKGTFTHFAVDLIARC